ncbi:indolepyruvate oxidoreductase subunit beta [Aminipila butyrica]|uniref:Indolepyruvate oxidoreductase subunit beta n=1 Tax=Aminipila butyrica TaxID=433296 RepID=A0A858BUS7_9FIRM|nr:indolepyruvate oxidoreductase subunit beta [Aminipila butyrica]QIB68939.1 indolepyruvate oxidoreductase subunit beta [Aminipila butyrica]
MSDVKNILLVGVGGQGTILASKILSEGLVEAGYDVKMSEIHGMSQRGGNVSTQIRYGKKVYSPIVGKGEADVIVAFEKMEALRWIEYLRDGGKMVINDFEIPSVPILMGQAEYPTEILEELSAKASVLAVKAAEIAQSLGNSKAMNIVLLGALVRAMNVEGVDWKKAVASSVKESFIELNLKAFDAGYNL